MAWWHSQYLQKSSIKLDRWPGGHASSDHGVQDNSLSGQFFNFCGFKYFCIAVAMCDLLHNVEKLYHI